MMLFLTMNIYLLTYFLQKAELKTEDFKPVQKQAQHALLNVE